MFTLRNLFLIIIRHMLIACSVVLLCLICIILISEEIEKVADSVAKNRKLASSLEQRTTLLTQLTKDASLIGNNQTIINHAFVPSDNIIEFISALESIALKNGITQTFRFSSPVSAAIPAPFPLNTISYQNTLTTNLPTFIQYLKDLENLPFFTKVDNIAIRAESAEGLAGVTSSVFNATIYTQDTP